MGGGVELLQGEHALGDALRLDADGVGEALHLLGAVGQELVQGRVEEADGDGEARHRAEDAVEVLALHGEDAGEGLAAAGLVLGEDHLADGEDAVLAEEHVLRAAEADALGAELAGLGRVLGSVGVGAHAEAAGVVAPGHQAREVVGQLGVGEGHGAEHDLAGGAVQGDDVAATDGEVAAPGLDAEGAGGVVDLEIAAAGHAALAPAARDDGGVGGHAAAGGEDALGGEHALDVLGAGLDAHEDDVLAGLGLLGRLLGGEHDLADGRAGEAGRPLAMTSVGRPRRRRCAAVRRSARGPGGAGPRRGR